MLVHEPRGDPSQEGRCPEDPVVVPDASYERRAEGARGVDAHAAHAALQPHQQRYNESHRQRPKPAPPPASTMDVIHRDVCVGVLMHMLLTLLSSHIRSGTMSPTANGLPPAGTMEAL